MADEKRTEFHLESGSMGRTERKMGGSIYELSAFSRKMGCF